VKKHVSILEKKSNEENLCITFYLQKNSFQSIPALEAAFIMLIGNLAALMKRFR
jgi:hypothetical protein